MEFVSDKKAVRDLIELCIQKNITKFIISPGSRNAPITLSLAENNKIDCLSIVDERSAGFIALGIAQQTQLPVAIVCTSGSAALNYAPAIVEAYYQQIPLVVITADRPKEWVNQGDGQTIHQENIFSNYIKGSFQLPTEPESDQEIWYNNRQINSALNLTVREPKGPIHLNIPFREPLYNKKELNTSTVHSFEDVQLKHHLSEESLATISTIWNNSAKKIILVGLNSPNDEFNTVIKEISNDPSVIIMHESCSNIHDDKFISCIDRTLAAIHEDEKNSFSPDVLITISNGIISKKIKHYFRNNPPQHHFNIDQNPNTTDTYQSLTHHIQTNALQFFKDIAPHSKYVSSEFAHNWLSKSRQAQLAHKDFIQNQLTYSDLKVYESIFKSIPQNSQLQLANSSVVRYAQLFDHNSTVKHYSNRGVSGIDGSTSTAVGAAFTTKEITTLITGDLSFFYDSNAFWNNIKPTNLKVIMINNGGGSIFRIIDGPQSTKNFETYFEAQHQAQAEHLAKAFNIDYISCKDEGDLEKRIGQLYQSDKCCILEIFTPNDNNDIELKNYFKYIKNT